MHEEILDADCAGYADFFWGGKRIDKERSFGYC